AKITEELLSFRDKPTTNIQEKISSSKSKMRCVFKGAAPYCPSATWSQVGRTVIGGIQGNATDQLHYPVGIFIDSNDCLFIADSRNDRVIKVEKGASIGTVVAGKLHTPTDVSVDTHDNLYIVDLSTSGGSQGRVTHWINGSLTDTLYFAEQFDAIVFDTKEEYFYVTQRDKGGLI
ncbi:unnamed protein product, partial [Rotaria magnacalcarata]